MYKTHSTMRQLCEFLESDPVILFNNTLNDVISRFQGVFSELVQSTEISGIKMKLIPDASNGGIDSFNKVEKGCQDYLEQLEYFIQVRRSVTNGSRTHFLIKACKRLQQLSHEMVLILEKKDNILSQKDPSRSLAFLFKRNIEPVIISIQQLLEQARKAIMVL